MGRSRRLIISIAVNAFGKKEPRGLKTWLQGEFVIMRHNPKAKHKRIVAKRVSKNRKRRQKCKNNAKPPSTDNQKVNIPLSILPSY